MNLATLATEVAARNCPVRVGLIGAGKFHNTVINSELKRSARVGSRQCGWLDHAYCSSINC